MNGKAFGNRCSPLSRRLSTSGSAHAWMNAMQANRSNRYRSQGDGERLAVQPMPYHARKVVLDAGAARRKLDTSADEQQRVALSAWEEEGGTVNQRR